MKYLYLLAFLLPCALSADEWVQVADLVFPPQYLSATVNDMSCPDSSNCYAFVQQTREYIIKHSTDQGRSWQTIYIADPWSEENPIMPNLSTCCSPHKDYLFLAMWERPIIKKSTDGGKTFKRIIIDTLIGSNDRKIYSLIMYNTKIGFAISSFYWFITKDGWDTFEKFENTWYGLYPDTYRAPSFIDSNTIGAWFISKSFDEKTSKFAKYNIENKKWTELYMIPEDPPQSKYSQSTLDLCFVATLSASHVVHRGQGMEIQPTKLFGAQKTEE